MITEDRFSGWQKIDARRMRGSFFLRTIHYAFYNTNDSGFHAECSSYAISRFTYWLSAPPDVSEYILRDVADPGAMRGVCVSDIRGHRVSVERKSCSVRV